MARIPTNRMQTHPGEMLLEEFLRPIEITQKHLVLAIHVPFQRISELVNGKRGTTPCTALKSSRSFGGTILTFG